MRPIRKKTAPAGVFPKRFLISTLRQLGQEVGLTVPTLVAPTSGGGRALPVRIHVYRERQAAHHVDIAPDPNRPLVEGWQRPWETGFAPAHAGGGKNAAGHPPCGEGAPTLAPPPAPHG